MPTNFSYCAWLHICSWLPAWQELKRVRDSWIAQLQQEEVLSAARLDASNRTVFFFPAVSLFFFSGMLFSRPRLSILIFCPF